MVPLALALDPRSSTPLHRQLYDEIRTAVLAGRLSAGARLPSTRTLASDLAISRNTVAGAFDQLLAEGYIASRPGAGTFVAKELPEELLRVSPGARTPAGHRTPAPQLSKRGRMLAATPVAPAARQGASACAFRPASPRSTPFPATYGRASPPASIASPRQTSSLMATPPAIRRSAVPSPNTYAPPAVSTASGSR